MPSTHSATTIQASVANTAGSTTTSTSITNTTGYGGIIFGSMTNGGTAPTLPCVAYLQGSNDNSTNWTSVQQAVGNLTASGITPFSFIVDSGYSYYRVQFVGNTAQSVTVIALSSQITGL